MHGLILVTWEKFLADNFGSSLLKSYRTSLAETPATSPLASRVYEDEMLLAGVNVASQLTGAPVPTLLRGYGCYFITNGLTSHLCAYLLTRVHNGRDLLLMMRDAHAQMRRVPEGLTPPLFGYEVHPTDPNTLMLIYDSPRKLCAVLLGAIEGAAERFGEQVSVVEQTCMLHGAATCRIQAHFTSLSSDTSHSLETPAQRKRRHAQKQLADMVLLTMPSNHEHGLTLLELQRMLQQKQADPALLRLSSLFEALRHLQYAGLVASTANQPGDDLAQRRYWRVPTSGM
jgi:hypothetical protein